MNKPKPVHYNCQYLTRNESKANRCFEFINENVVKKLLRPRKIIRMAVYLLQTLLNFTEQRLGYIVFTASGSTIIMRDHAMMRLNVGNPIYRLDKV